MNEEKIRKFTGEVIGIIEHYENGDQIARAFPSRAILGKYDAANDYTRDFYGKVVAKGNALSSLIYNNLNK